MWVEKTPLRAESPTGVLRNPGAALRGGGTLTVCYTMIFFLHLQPPSAMDGGRRYDILYHIFLFYSTHILSLLGEAHNPIKELY
jgi:hypothetical protein